MTRESYPIWLDKEHLVEFEPYCASARLGGYVRVEDIVRKAAERNRWRSSFFAGMACMAVIGFLAWLIVRF